MKSKVTVRFTENERTTLSKLLMLKSKAQYPKQDTEQFSRIINMLGHPRKKKFNTTEYKLICREVKDAARLISKVQSGCIKIIEKTVTYSARND